MSPGRASVADRLERQVARTIAVAWRTGLPLLGRVAPTAAERMVRSHPMTDADLVRLFDRVSESMPGTTPTSSFAPITGDRDADARIYRLATERGYRPRGEAAETVPIGSQSLHPVAANGWKCLSRAAARRGTPILLLSGFRPVERQREFFTTRLDEWSTDAIASGAADDAIRMILRRFAPPGGSKHHTGLAADISGLGGDLPSFSQTLAYRWLSADSFAAARSFGWAPSYPPHASQGPDPEPWEFVYVGPTAIVHDGDQPALVGDATDIGALTARRRRGRG